jgi:hypothetical protein
MVLLLWLLVFCISAIAILLSIKLFRALKPFSVLRFIYYIGMVLVLMLIAAFFIYIIHIGISCSDNPYGCS